MTTQALQNVPVLGADTKPLGVLDIRDAMKVLLEQGEFEERLSPTKSQASATNRLGKNGQARRWPGRTR